MPRPNIKTVYPNSIEVVRDKAETLEVSLSKDNAAIVFAVSPTNLDKKGLRIIVNYTSDALLTDHLNTAIKELSSETNIKAKIIASKAIDEKVIKNMQRILNNFAERLNRLTFLTFTNNSLKVEDFINTIDRQDTFQLTPAGKIEENKENLDSSNNDKSTFSLSKFFPRF